MTFDENKSESKNEVFRSHRRNNTSIMKTPKITVQDINDNRNSSNTIQNGSVVQK